MSFKEKQIEFSQNLYNDASLGLTTGKKYLIIQNQMVWQDTHYLKSSIFEKLRSKWWL